MDKDIGYDRVLLCCCFVCVQATLIFTKFFFGGVRPAYSWKKIVLTRRKGFLEENRVDEEKRTPGRKSSIQ